MGKLILRQPSRHDARIYFVCSRENTRESSSRDIRGGLTPANVSVYFPRVNYTELADLWTVGIGLVPG